MTTSTMARRHTAACPNPEEQPRVIDNRNYERLLNGIKAGTVRLDTRDYRYRNTSNNADLDDVAYDAEEKGWVELPAGRDPKVTAAGEKWLADRYATLGPSPTRPLFLAPDVDAAAQAAKPGAYRGERIHTARLTGAQVQEIRQRLSAGERASVVARDYGVSHESIRQIRDGKAWRHVA